jgi:methylated-DNA-[protein]-cysteine S-methyltransferase
MTTMQTTIASPVGPLALTVDDDGALTRLGFGHGDASDDPRFAPAVAQLREYFAGERTAFDLPVRPEGGTAFERRVWTELLTIPYGETASYGEIAARIGHPGKARAVGRANARNPVAIVCPCHRVIGSDGSLTGFGGGLENKRTLLDLEAGALTLAMDTA